MREANLQESFEKFQHTAQYKRISEKFRKKTYNQANWLKFYLCKLLSIICGVGSVFFAYVYATEWGTDLVKSSTAALCLSLFVLVVLEIVQRFSLGSFFFNMFTYGLKIKDLGNATLCIIITAFSVFLSYKGSFKQVEKWNGTPPQYIAPTLLSEKKINNRYDPLILQAQKIASNYQDNNQQVDKITGKLIWNWHKEENYHENKYNAKLQNVLVLQEKKFKALEKLELKNENLISQAKETHASTLSSFKQKNQSKGANLGYITLVLQLVMFVCVIFCEYYDYRVEMDFESKTFELEKQKIIDEFLRTQKGQKQAQNNFEFEPKKGAKSDLLKVTQSAVNHNFEYAKKAQKKGAKPRSKSKDLSLSLSQISSKIGTYKRAVNTYLEEGKIDLVERNKSTLRYWENIKAEKLRNINSVSKTALRIV